MPNFEDLKQKAIETAGVVADKSVELYRKVEEKAKTAAQYARLTADIAKDKNAVQKLYTEIGKQYYGLYSSAPAAELAANCEKVSALLARMADTQKELDALKKADPDAAEAAEAAAEDAADAAEDAAEAAAETVEDAAEEEKDAVEDAAE